MKERSLLKPSDFANLVERNGGTEVLSLALGVSSRSLRYWLSGEVEMPRVAEIALAYLVSPSGEALMLQAHREHLSEPLRRLLQDIHDHDKHPIWLNWKDFSHGEKLLIRYLMDRGYAWPQRYPRNVWRVTALGKRVLGN